MIPLTVTDEVAGVLGGYIDAVEVRDSKGRLLGHFLPYLTPAQRDFYAHPEAHFDLKEAERILAEERDKGLPLAEVWKRIRAGEIQG
jgi:hypothetical protein